MGTCDLLCLDLPHAERIQAGLAEPDTLAAATTVGRALADPTRLGIASALRAGSELCVCDMAWVVGHAQDLVSHHLRQLKNAGLVASRRDGKLLMYRLTPTGTALIAAVLELPVTPAPLAAAGPTPHASNRAAGAAERS